MDVNGKIVDGNSKNDSRNYDDWDLKEFDFDKFYASQE